MNSEEYQRFTTLLTQNLEADSRVLGLVALGSMAAQDYQPDRWSDHDFFVITGPGEQESFRQDLSWIPCTGEIVLYFRETEHGLKVLYRNGHLLEFAVFDMEEIRRLITKLNRYRVLLDRDEIEDYFAGVKLASPQAENPTSTAAEDFKTFGMFLCNLQVGVGRYRRGEQLSGHQFVKQHALQHLLILLAKYLDSSGKSLLDNYDPFRRFERAFPETGAEINNILMAEVPKSAQGLLSLAERELKGKFPDYPEEAVRVLKELLG